MQKTISLDRADGSTSTKMTIKGQWNGIREIKRYAIRHTYDTDGNPEINLEQICGSNLSSEFSELIQNAGRFCERFASDVMFDINRIQNLIKNPLQVFDGEAPKDHRFSQMFLFGFRQDGVDHLEFVNAKFKSKEHGAFDYYRSIYGLEVFIDVDAEGKYVSVKVGFGRLDS